MLMFYAHNHYNRHQARGGGNGDEAEIEAGSDEDVPGGACNSADPIVRALGRARGVGNGDEAEIEADLSLIHISEPTRPY